MVRLTVALFVAVFASGLLSCGRRHSEVVVSGQSLVAALCASWTRCADELGPLGSIADCQAALAHCQPVVFANTQAELDACVSAVEQATCFDLAETPFGGAPVIDSFNDARRGGELLLAWLQRRFGVCGDLWVARPNDAPGIGDDCGAQPCADAHTYCDRDSLRCRPQGRVGDHCVAASNANSDCRHGLRCDATTARCADWPLLGPGEDCSDNLWCNTALCSERRGSVKCRLKVENGGWCDRDAVCYGHRVCRANACTDRGGEAAGCDSDGQCLLGFACRELGDTRRCSPRSLCP